MSTIPMALDEMRSLDAGASHGPPTSGRDPDLAERAFWESAADDLDTARCRIWAEVEGGAWEAGVAACLSALTPLRDALSVPKARCLDLGCGIGRLMVPLAREWPSASFIGVDVSPRMLDLGRAVAKDEGLRNVRWSLGDGRALPRIGKLTAALSVVTFQHVPRAATASYIEQVAERLVSGGVFRFQFVNDAGEDAFLSHGLQEALVAASCEQAGLRVKDVDVGLVYDVWSWVTAVKP